MMWRGLLVSLFCSVLLLQIPLPARAADAPPPPPYIWPPTTHLTRPWTRWWCPGSAVDKQNLSDLLHQYHDAGVGGVEICPIYGVYGYENRYINYLTPKWMQALGDATDAAASLNMPLDMTTGTGWPMGGPTVTTADASSTFTIQRFDIPAGGELSQSLSGGRIQCVYAYGDSGDQIDLTPRVKDNAIQWSPLAGSWKVYALLEHGPAMQVKRSAPGGEGNVLDPFSTDSVDHFLSHFDDAFANYKGRMPLSQFHDSYEYVGNWTPNFFDQFKLLRGYDLRTQLPALNGEGDPDSVARVLCDYRQTLADLHSAYLQHWIAWCHKHGMLSREQAHGAPVDLLDL